MNVSKVIKKILLEAAGISFEVRKWAEVIEKYVDNYINVEKEKLKSSQPKQQPQTKSPYGSWSYNDQEIDDSPTETSYTHFETEDGQIFTEKAMVYADELNINADILEDFPNIKNAISGKLFVIEFNDDGGFYVESKGSNFPEEYRVAIDEMIEDHMVVNGTFYTDDYDLVYASDYNDVHGKGDNPYSYMTENNSWDGYGSFGGYSNYYSPQPKIDKIEINGNDFPDAYKDFKVDKWVIINSGRIEYDHNKSGYNDNGEYVVYLNMPMSAIGGSALVHEIKHAYDDWNRMSRGAPPLRDGWEIQNIYTADFEKLVLGGSFKLSPMLHPIIRYYYLGSKLESPAYLENEYDNSSLGGGYRSTAKKLMSFKASNFLNKKGQPAKGLQESWTELITEYNIPFFRKFKNVIDFLNYTEKYFNKRGRDILKRIDKMRYVHDKPEPVYEPKKWEKPKTTTPTHTEKPKTPSNQLSLFNEPKTDNKVEIEKLTKQIDYLEGEFDKLYNEDRNKNKIDLEELDVTIQSLVKKRDELEFGSSLPF
jgi:hypothetical protein